MTKRARLSRPALKATGAAVSASAPALSFDAQPPSLEPVMPSKGVARRDIASGSPSRKSSSDDHSLVKHLTFNAVSGCGELCGLAAVELRRLPSGLILPGWPVFRVADSGLRVGPPRVLGPYPLSHYTAISSSQFSQLIAEVRAVLLDQHPDLLLGGRP